MNVQSWLRFHFADLHSHTAYSDGTLTPAIAHEYARDKAKLDVFCLTDHLESVDEIVGAVKWKTPAACSSDQPRAARN